MPCAQHGGDHQRRNTSCHMHHDAAGKIHRAPRRKPAAAPHPMRHRHIDDQQPQARDQQHRAEFDALDIGADDQRRRDDGERHFEHHIDAFGNGGARMHGAPRDIGQQRRIEIADPGPAAAESQAVAANEPQHRSDTGHRETLHQHRQDILGLHQPAVKQRQGRQGHQQHQRRRTDNPAGIAAIDHAIPLWTDSGHVHAYLLGKLLRAGGGRKPLPFSKLGMLGLFGARQSGRRPYIAPR